MLFLDSDYFGQRRRLSNVVLLSLLCESYFVKAMFVHVKFTYTKILFDHMYANVEYLFILTNTCGSLVYLYTIVGLCANLLVYFIQEEATAIKAAGKAWYKTMISDSDYTEFDNFTKWLGVAQ